MQVIITSMIAYNYATTTKNIVRLFIAYRGQLEKKWREQRKTTGSEDRKIKEIKREQKGEEREIDR